MPMSRWAVARPVSLGLVGRGSSRVSERSCSTRAETHGLPPRFVRRVPHRTRVRVDDSPQVSLFFSPSPPPHAAPPRCVSRRARTPLFGASLRSGVANRAVAGRPRAQAGGTAYDEYFAVGWGGIATLPACGKWTPLICTIHSRRTHPCWSPWWSAWRARSRAVGRS